MLISEAPKAQQYRSCCFKQTSPAFAFKGPFPAVLPAASTPQHALKDQYLVSDLHQAIKHEERLCGTAAQKQQLQLKKGCHAGSVQIRREAGI